METDIWGLLEPLSHIWADSVLLHALHFPALMYMVVLPFSIPPLDPPTSSVNKY